jgi:hypothetical protein
MAQPRRCVKCQKIREIHGHEMCKKCWGSEYNRKSTTKDRKRLWSQKPEAKESKRLWSQRYNQRPDVKKRARALRKKREMNPKVAKCRDCKLVKKIHHIGLCRYCHDNQRYGGSENVKKMNRERMQEHRKTPEAKITAKAYNALESTKIYKAKYAREWRKDPENEKKRQRAERRWKYTHQERYSKANKVRCRSYYFFRAGKPVGPFDPSEIRNSSLLQAVKEVREGNLEPLKQENAYE